MMYVLLGKYGRPTVRLYLRTILHLIPQLIKTRFYSSPFVDVDCHPNAVVPFDSLLGADIICRMDCGTIPKSNGH